jgi:hypothetical protein
MTHRIVAMALSLAALAPGQVARAAEPVAAARAAEGVDAVVAQAAEAMAAGRDDDAIAALEALADRGIVHPDASFDRGLAYARRARSERAASGDLGRAAAGFEEALLLRPSDAEAAAALEVVRGEVARRRARRGKDDVSVGDPPDRLVVGLLPELGWAALAVASSLVLALGLELRRRPPGPLRVAGALGVPLGALGVLLFTPATWWAGLMARERGLGVVVAPEVTLVDDAGGPVDAPVVPEAARVETGERRGERVHVRWGSYEGWAPNEAVRRLHGA